MDEIQQFLKDLKEVVSVQQAPKLGRPYERAIIPAIANLQRQIQEQYIAQQELQKKRKDAVISNLPLEVLDYIDEQSGDCVDNEIFLRQQMAVIAEMRLVYLYKSYEITLKQMLIDAYDVDVADLFSWKKQKALLYSMNIRPYQIIGYKELDELRIIVNNIKHGTALEPISKAISEFKDADEITYETGTTFYERIEPIVNIYIEKLSQLVFTTLYPETS